jgi:magnesium-protoporphyrin O-methyltransferase
LQPVATGGKCGNVETASTGNLLSRAFCRGFNLVIRLTRSSFRGFAHPPGAMLAVLEDRGLRRTFQRRRRIWQVAGLERVS